MRSQSGSFVRLEDYDFVLRGSKSWDALRCHFDYVVLRRRHRARRR